MRPEIFKDLDESTLRGSQVLSVETDNFPADGAMYTALGAFLNAAAKAHLVTEKGYSRLTLYLPPTTEQLEKSLRDAQESWDSARQMYQAAVVSGTEPEDYTKHTIRRWAEKEGQRIPWAPVTTGITDY